MKKMILIPILIVMLSGVSISFAAENIVDLSIPSFDTYVSGVKIDNLNSTYPLIVYKDITYVPMTWNYSKALGLNIEWSGDTGLKLSRGGNVEGLTQDLEGENDLNKKHYGQIASFAIEINGSVIDNSAQTYPLLLFRDITYIPLTWDFAVGEFDLAYDFTPESGLSLGNAGDIIEIETEESYVEPEFDDILTPKYYTLENDDPFVLEMLKYLHFAQLEKLNHPLASSTGEIPFYNVTTQGSYGAFKGSGSRGEHHPATDMYVGSKETDVNTYASHEGYVSVYRDSNKYRNHLTITKDVVDDSGNVLGKIVTLYAYIDLDLNESEGLSLDGKYVERGDLVSKNLYSGTKGGAHLHYEIRYYRNVDSGEEEFMGIGTYFDPAFVEASTGPWEYGYWNPDVGYGYGNPKNHGIENN